MTNPHRPEALHDLLHRIRMEFLEMPDLKLTRAQVRRLWSLNQAECDLAIARLVTDRFLRESPGGTLLRMSSGRS